MTADVDLLLLTRSLGYGGAEWQLARLALGAAERGHNVRVVVFYGGGPLQALLEASGVPVAVLGKSSRWDILRFARSLFRAIVPRRPRVLYAFLGTANVLAALLKPWLGATRVVWSVRASSMDLTRYGWLDRLQYRLERLLSPAADSIVVNSHAGASHAIASGFPRARVRVICNGIDTGEFRRDEAARATLRAEWGVASGDLLIGLVGRLDPMKDHESFLRAAAAFARVETRARYVCVGDGPPGVREELQALATRLGLADRLQWQHARRDMTAVYSALDMLCSASAFGEGFSNVIGEAMACELPCVVTDVGDSANIVGDAGLVTPPRDAQALVAAWLELRERGPAGRAALGQQARRRIVENFALDRMIRDTLAALGL